MNLTPIIVAVSIALGFGGAWSLRGHQIDKLELSHANERIEVQASIATALAANQRQVAAAQTGAAKRNVRVRVDADRAGNAAGGLRLATEATVRTVEADPAACDTVVAAYSAVVATSSDFIRAVSADADQCHSDLTLMTEAWPKD